MKAVPALLVLAASLTAFGGDGDQGGVREVRVRVLADEEVRAEPGWRDRVSSLMVAVSAFIITVQTGSAFWGVVAAAGAGALFNVFFGFLVISRRANQLACGLAMMFFGVGFSALLGAPYIGSRITGSESRRSTIRNFWTFLPGSCCPSGGKAAHCP